MAQVSLANVSAESDTHAPAHIPRTLALHTPPQVTTTHRLFYSNNPILQNEVTMPFTTQNLDSYVNNLLQINLNNWKTPIQGIFRFHAGPGSGWNRSPTTIWSDMQYDSAQSAQGTHWFRDTYKSSKVISSRFEVEIYNCIGYDNERAFQPIRGYTMVNKGQGAPFSEVDAIWYPITAEDQQYTHMFHPEVRELCGGAVLGPCTMSGFNGAVGDSMTHSFAPVWKTVFEYDSSKNLYAEDVTNTGRIVEWPLNANDPPPYRLSIGVGPSHSAPQEGQRHVLLGIRIKGEYTVSWRDLLNPVNRFCV